MASVEAIQEGMARGMATRDFGLPHRDSSDGKSIEYPIAIDQSLIAAADKASEKQFYLHGLVDPPKVETGDQSRKDDGKTRGYYLIPQRPLAELARLYAIGAAKYAPRGWEKGMEWSRIVDPMFRHLGKWIKGEKYDQVDGQHHLAAVAWACFALMEYEETHPELDDVHPHD